MSELEESSLNELGEDDGSYNIPMGDKDGALVFRGVGEDIEMFSPAEKDDGEIIPLCFLMTIIGLRLEHDPNFLEDMYKWFDGVKHEINSGDADGSDNT